MEWKADLHEVDGLRKWYGKQPRLVRVACGTMLNEFAFGVRTEAIKQIGRFMIVRNPKFVSGRIRVTKARITAPVEVQAAWTGSVATNRFTGWTEQEFGKKAARNRLATIKGRGGDKTKQIRHAVRLKPKNDVVTMDDPDYQPKGDRLGGFIAMVMRKKERRLIRIKGSFYKRNRKKLELVQSMDGKKQPKRLRWMRKARAIYFRKTNLDALWRKTVDRTMRPPGKS